MNEAAALVGTWADAVLRQADLYPDAWNRLNEAWDRFDRGDGESRANDERSKAFRKLWAEAHLLVWSARQLEVWMIRLAGQHALNTVAAGGDWKKPLWKALLALPEKALETAIVDDGRLFGLAEPDRLERAAREALEQIDSERLDRAVSALVEPQRG